MIELIVIIVFIGFIGLEILHYFERKKLLSRIMSKTYQEYEYYDKVFPKEAKEQEKLREEAREVRKIEREETIEMEEEYGPKPNKELGDMEENWGSQEVDIVKLKEIIEEKE